MVFSGLDPSTTPAADYADAITGDFYYNSTTGQFKTVNTGGAPIGSWSSGDKFKFRLDNVGAGNGSRQQTAIVIAVVDTIIMVSSARTSLNTERG